MAGRLSFLLIAWAFLPAGLSAQVNDPTRPSYHNVPAAAESVAPASRLTSIVHKRSGKSYAVIDGEIVPLNGKIGGATLVKIRENSVLLQQDDAVEVLELTPGIEKTRNRPQTRVKAEKPS